MNVRFDLESDSDSLRRAREDDHNVARTPDGSGWLVFFEDGDEIHRVDLERTPDGWDGDCHVQDLDSDDRFERCPGLVYHDGPCAHLWAVRSTIAQERQRDRDERHAQDVDRARADGGRRVRR